MRQVEDTDAEGIAAQFLTARREAGSPAMGMVMTLVIVVEEQNAKAAMGAARKAAREHPARLLGVVIGSHRGASRIDAEVDVGARDGGEQGMIRLSGPVTRHAESVVLPLLLPDSPVVVWWPGKAPDEPGADPVGMLAQRRITDAAAVPRAKGRAMFTQCRGYADGNTDLAWTRITGWRALLASALDQVKEKVSGASVTAERISPSADLLSAWLADRLKVRVDRHFSKGPGITQVVLRTRSGDTALARTDGRLATLSSPGQPDRPIALKRREVPELLTEELRRLDPDDAYRDTVKKLLRDHKKRTAQ